MSLLIIHDPLHLHRPAIRKALEQVIASGNNAVDVLVTPEIHTPAQLNDTLANVFGTIRHEATDLGCDHTYSIDVFFNQALDQSGYNVVEVDQFLENTSIQPSHYRTHDTTAVGGTFDHIHDGHKILLLMTIFLTKRRMIVGITGPELLRNKKFSSVLEPYELRQNKVVEYIQKHMHHARFEVYQINDICGPTGYIADIQALVVSHESAKGGQFVNSYRQERGMPLLEVVAIDVIGTGVSADNNWKGKLSSTDIREAEYIKLRR